MLIYIKIYICTDSCAGRTARIGNEGLATSFYNDDDEPLGQFLVNILTECKQEIPDFLSQYKSADDTINWNDDSEADDDDEANGALTTDADTNAGWGAGGDSGTPGTNGVDTVAWGADNAAAVSKDDWGFDGPTAPQPIAAAW